MPSLFRSRPLCLQSPVPLRAQLTRAQLLLIRRGRSFYLSIHALVAPHVPLGRGSEQVADPFETKDKTRDPSSQKNRHFFLLQIISEGTCIS